jgi:cysteine desulfurase
VPYWDHNATSPLRPEVAAFLREGLGAFGGNPASVHRLGQRARARLTDARARVAAVLGVEPKEIVFTASGSESNALALRGAFEARRSLEKNRLVLSAIEHPALLGTAKALEGQGVEVVRIAPGPDGRVDPEALISALDPRTLLCSLMWANNETGVLQPVGEVARACREQGVLFHTDAVQAVGKTPVTLREADADLLSLAAHKFGGPIGAAALVVRRGVTLQPLTAGHQEGGLRGGTVNVLYAEALALALELATRELERTSGRLASLRDRFETAVTSRLPGARVNGASASRLPNTSSITFPGADGEALLIALDLEGICVSTGAACASGSLTPSHVLTAIGLSPEQAQGTLRFSLGAEVDETEVDQVVAALERHLGTSAR